MSERPNFSAYCEQACRKLWGEPTRTTGNVLRWTNGGDAYSDKTFNLKKRVWYDHGAQAGGSTLELVSHSRGEPIKELRGADFFEAWRKGHELGIIPDPPPAKDDGNLKIRRTYPYHDENGDLLFEVVRYDTEVKDDRFRQRRPDGRGGWISNTAGVRKILYRLPELVEGISQDRPVLLCEGEHDADTARKLGYIATTAPGGAEKPWRNEYSETLRGADVIVVSDNDQHGRGQRHAEKVARTLSGGIARRVRVITFPVKDLSDWLAAGRTREELDTLIEQAPQFDPSEQTDAPSEPAGLDVIDAGEDDWNVPPREWLLANVFCREFISSLLADGGTGKTALRYAQYLSLAIGRSLTGEHVFQRCRVLVVSLEDSISELRRRMKAACLHHGILQKELTGWLFYAAIGAASGKLMMTDAKGRAVVGPLAASLEKTIVDKRIDLVALDPFVKTHAVEENHNSAIDGVVQILSDLAIAHSIAVDAPHHTSKGLADPGNANRGRGASAMKDAARLVYTLAPMTDEEGKALGVDKAEQKSLIRMDSGKVNIAPAMTEAKWFRLVGVPLGNANERYPNGDAVQTVEPWSPRSIWRDLSVETVNAILDKIELGPSLGRRFSAASSARERAAWQCVTSWCPTLSEAQARKVIKTWVENGLLVEKEYYDDVERKDRLGLYVDNAKRPGSDQ